MAATEEVLLGALAGGASGALFSGFASFTVGRAADVRKARAHIYVDEVLSKLHNPLHDIVVGLREGGKPVRTSRALGEQYSRLMRAASAASNNDVRRLKPWNVVWDDLAYTWDDHDDAVKSVRPNARSRSKVTEEYRPKIVSIWEKLDAILDEYDKFVDWKLRKRWFWCRPIARVYWWSRMRLGGGAATRKSLRESTTAP